MSTFHERIQNMIGEITMETLRRQFHLMHLPHVGSRCRWWHSSIWIMLEINSQDVHEQVF
jgi:hypothetical protein